MKKILLSLCLAGSLCAASAQNEITYTVSFPNAIHHEAEISMVVPNIPPGTLTVRMARSSPGRYATHEFGKNVYKVRVTDAAGKSLRVNQAAGDIYQVPIPGKLVKVTYTVYGNWIDGTYAGFDRNYAHINMPAVFMFPVGMDKRPRIVQFNYPEKPYWKAATQLKPMGSDKFYARDLQYFMDSPTELADFKAASWQVKDAAGKTQTIHYIANAPDAQPVIDKFAGMIRKMVDESVAIWGEFPKYDYGNYYFLQSVNPENAGDGMEHRNSTVIVERDAKVEGNESDQLSTFSHEYFHSWNVERFRPKTLEPFNFEHANMSNELWMAEGFTQYYGGLILKRAGFRTLDECAQTFTGIVNTVLTSPGAKDYSAVEASRYAVFADAGVSIDQTNKVNIFTSYYTYGASIALALDLRLRSEYKLTLDHYMRALWAAYGRTELAYTIPDLQKTLAVLTKDAAFADAFFKQYVYGTAKNDYAALLLKAGMVLRKSGAGNASTGIRVTFASNRAVIGGTTKGSPAYNAGLDVGDVLIKADGDEIKNQNAFNKITSSHKPGDKIQVVYLHRGTEYTTTLTFGEDQNIEVVPIEKTGRQPTPEMAAFRNQWLETQVK